MTVSSTTTKVSYSGNGSLTVFAYTFKVFDQADLKVIVRTDATGTETVKTITTDYTVSGVGNTSGGNVTFVTAPASGETVVIRREASLTQTTDYTPNDPFPASSHEDALDKLTFFAQQQQEELDRAIKLSRTNTITSTEFTVGATDRANKILAFDGNGEISVTQELGTFQGDWSASTTYAARDIVKDTSTNNIFIANTAHTSSGSQPLTTNTDSAKWDLLVDAASATTSATNAATSATAAATSATAAATSATNAATSETNAATSETNAATSETNASTSETNAATSATSAATSATTATTQATAASTSATNAATSETNAATSETNAATSETNAATSASNASTSETNAASSASAASTSATNAATSETNAATSASNASTSETNAATSASAAAASQTAAAASAASAASAYDSFDDRYLGTKSSDPTLDNDGNALVSGALYFNTTANEMRVYDGANWIAATSAGGVSLILYEYTATSGQTTFSGADDNAATLSYTADNIQVFMNGVNLDPSDYTATNGTSVVLASGAAVNDVLNIYAFTSFTVADTVSASSGGTFSANVAVTGDLTVDTNTLYVDSTNNRVGIGTSSPSQPVEIAKDAGQGATPPTLRITNTKADYGSSATTNVPHGAIEFYMSEGSGNYPAVGAAIKAINESIYAENHGLAFFTNSDTSTPTERLRILSSGGITFNGDTAAANALDDYEEGTWTATHGGNNMTVAAGLNPSYVKIGRLVTVCADVTSATGSSTTNVIGGLPFTSANLAGTAAVAYVTGSSAAAGAYVSTNGTSMTFIQNGGTSGASISAGDRIIFKAIYYTDA